MAPPRKTHITDDEREAIDYALLVQRKNCNQVADELGHHYTTVMRRAHRWGLRNGHRRPMTRIPDPVVLAALDDSDVADSVKEILRRRAAERGYFGVSPIPIAEGYITAGTTTIFDGDGNVKRHTVATKRDRGEVHEVREGHAVKGESAFVDADGRVIAKWVKTAKAHERSVEDVVAACKAAFDSYGGRAKPLPPPAVVSDDLLTLLPCADWHLGLHIWGKEAGADWSLKEAERVIFERAQELIATAPRSGIFVVLSGGDLLHADNYSGETARSGNRLDVDSRWPKVLATAQSLMARIVEVAAQNHGRVIVRILPGNHDEHSAIAVAHALNAWFRADERIHVDTDPGLFWHHVHGRVMLAATHGHACKVTTLPEVMAARRPEDWGKTTYRYAHGFHLHRTERGAGEQGGVMWEVHQTPVPKDAWAHGQGYVSARSMKAITYHAEAGEIARATRMVAPT